MAERQALHAVKPAKSANWEEHSVRSTNEEIDFRRTYQNTTIWVPTVTRRDQEEIRGVSEQEFNGNDQNSTYKSAIGTSLASGSFSDKKISLEFSIPLSPSVV